MLKRVTLLFGKIIAVTLLLSWSLMPILWIILTSLKTRVDIFTSPPKFIFQPNLDAYKEILSFGVSLSIIDNIKNSLIIALSTTLMVLILSAIAAYAFSRYTFPARRTLLFVILGTRLLPPITALVPLFLMMRDLRLLDRPLSLIIIYTALMIPFATWMMKSFFDGIPVELEEAALIDGTSKLGALRHVTIPLAAPGLAATAIFIFVLAWNEFMFAFMFTSVKSQTVPVVLSLTLGEMEIYWQRMAAEATILILPVLFFSYFLQRHMVKGLTAGALK